MRFQTELNFSKLCSIIQICNSYTGLYKRIRMFFRLLVVIHETGYLNMLFTILFPNRLLLSTYWGSFVKLSWKCWNVFHNKCYTHDYFSLKDKNECPWKSVSVCIFLITICYFILMINLKIQDSVIFFLIIISFSSFLNRKITRYQLKISEK